MSMIVIALILTASLMTIALGFEVARVNSHLIGWAMATCGIATYMFTLAYLWYLNTKPKK
jgi:xanthine/uracil permease